MAQNPRSTNIFFDFFCGLSTCKDNVFSCVWTVLQRLHVQMTIGTAINFRGRSRSLGFAKFSWSLPTRKHVVYNNIDTLNPKNLEFVLLRAGKSVNFDPF